MNIRQSLVDTASIRLLTGSIGVEVLRIVRHIVVALILNLAVWILFVNHSCP